MSLCLIDVHGDIEGDFDWVVDLPRNTTNGDVIKTLFPNVRYKEGGYSTTLYFDKIIGTIVPSEWWNAPYKENKE